MSDDIALEAGKLAISSGGSVGLFALIKHWMDSKKSEELSAKLEGLNTGFALISQKLDELVRTSSKHEAVSERVALLERDVKNLTEQLRALMVPPPKVGKGQR